MHFSNVSPDLPPKASASGHRNLESARWGRGLVGRKALKVLHVVATGTRRGAEIFASDLVRALREAGISQWVAVLHGDPPFAVEYEAPVIPLQGDGRRVPGLRIDAHAVRSLRAAVGELAPDIVQTHGSEPLKCATLATLVGPPTELVHRRIGSAHELISHGLRRAAYGVQMRRAARVVTVADVVRQETVDLFRIRPPAAVMIPNAVDPNRLQLCRGRDATRSLFGISTDALVVASVGALTWEKDPIGQLGVAERFLSYLSEAMFLMVGDGPLRSRVDAQIRRMGLIGRVVMSGVREDVPDILRASDLLLLASRTEGMPGVVIEAGMLGVPVAGYALAGVPEVVIHGLTGVLTAPADREGLARSVAELLMDADVRRAMGEAARERCRAVFDIRTVAPRYLQLYEEVISLKGAVRLRDS